MNEDQTHQQRWDSLKENKRVVGAMLCKIYRAGFSEKTVTEILQHGYINSDMSMLEIDPLTDDKWNTRGQPGIHVTFGFGGLDEELEAIPTITFSIVMNSDMELSIFCRDPSMLSVTGDMVRDGVPTVSADDMASFVGMIFTYANSEDQRSDIIKSWNLIREQQTLSPVVMPKKTASKTKKKIPELKAPAKKD